MSVSLQPSNALGFRRPLTQLIRRSLTITNHNSQPIAFKVKTTAPKLYCVRPNSGRVEPGDSIDVSVMLQALKEEPPLNTKCKDKFLIQSTLITPDKETLPLTEIWAPEKNDESKVHQQKLKVVYLPAEGQIEEEEESYVAPKVYPITANDSHQDAVRSANVSLENGNNAIPRTSLEEPRPASPPLAAAEYSVAREESHDISPEEFPTAPRPPSPQPVMETEPTHEREIPIVTIPVVQRTPVPAVVVSHDGHVNEELLANYRNALAEIERLKVTLAAAQAAPPPELRRRTRVQSDVGSVADTDVQTMVEENPLHQDGVPLQVVVIISLGVFITTYLFF